MVRGSGKMTTENRSVSGFDQVSVTGSGDLTIKVGDQESLTIEAEDNILPYITSDVSGGKLELGTKRGYSINPTRPIRYNLTVKSLKDVSMVGSGSITGADLKADDFKITLLGSGNIKLDRLTASTLTVQLTGSGNIDVNGKAQTQEVRIPGSGKYTAGDLESDSAKTSITGSGQITVWAKNTLDVSISGSGEVAYFASPKITQKISGSGSVRSLGEHK